MTYRTTRRNWIFTHVGLSAHAHKVEVHEWLSGIEELTIYFAALFFTLVANK